MSRLSTVKKNAQWLPVLLLLAVLFGVFLQQYLWHQKLLVGQSPEAVSKVLRTSDADHYFDIAENFHSGDYSFSYLRQRAHRQPLYPFVLNITMSITGWTEPHLFLWLNTGFFLLSILMVYLIGSRVLMDPWVGFMVALVYALSAPMRNLTYILYADCLYSLLLLIHLGLFLKALKTNNRILFWVSGAVCGLAYLTRPNGLFLFLGVLCSYMAYTIIRVPRVAAFRSIFKEWIRWLVPSVVIFVIVALPSWLPRLLQFGNPFYHGYLSNFLWVRSYSQGHVSGPPRFGLRYFLEHNDVWQILDRVQHGLVSVYFKLLKTDIFFSLYVLCFLAILVQRSRLGLTLLLQFFVVMFPVVWTYLSNPTARVAQSSMYGYIVVILMFGLIYIRQRWVSDSIHRYNPT